MTPAPRENAAFGLPMLHAELSSRCTLAWCRTDDPCGVCRAAAARIADLEARLAADARAEAMEEAARAVCGRCRRGEPLTDDASGAATCHAASVCPAAAIRALARRVGT